MRTACTAMNKADRTPYSKEMLVGVEIKGRELDGAMPTKNPKETHAAAIMVLPEGTE